MEKDTNRTPVTGSFEDRRALYRGVSCDNAVHIIGEGQRQPAPFTCVLGRIGMEIKGNWQIFPIEARGIRFPGYVIYPDHVLLKKATKKRMQRATKHISKWLDDPDYILDRHDLGTIYSYEGCLKWCNGKNLQHRTFEGIYEKNRRNLERKKVIGL